MLDSFAAKNAPLVALIKAARAAGDDTSARVALAELILAYTRLGNREAGTIEEQNAYIVARRLGALPTALVELGVSEADLPMGAVRRPPAASCRHEGIAEHFLHVRGRDEEEPPGRFAVEHRPQDNMRYQGRLQPFALIDRTDGLPVAWYDNRDRAEMIADAAGRLRRTD
ncbi:hypothetical protein [Streptomyces hirsutus]|uniref:hypothetical protein n=1 Tax=Streptomyces hirsutus TaxID=35620 RepID=UPI00332D0B61